MKYYNIICILAVVVILPPFATTSSPLDNWIPFDATSSSFGRWKSPSKVAYEIRRQALSQGPLTSMIFATAVVNTKDFEFLDTGHLTIPTKAFGVSN